MCVLRVIADGPTYGYAIAAALEEAGIGTVKGGTLYPLLTRFESAGWVEIEWRAGDGGPGRKYYTLTPAGQAEQARQAQEWAEFSQVTADFVAVTTDQETSSGRGHAAVAQTGAGA